MLFFIFTIFSSGFALQTVTTSYGDVRGITDYSDKFNHKFIFKGIPFAKPPLGNLRFALPEQPDPWKNVLDASKYRSACLSNSSVSSTPQKNVDEDCLYLNIFSSQECMKTKACPVIVYFHGGSFNLDAATMFPDRFISERYTSQGIVFVIPAFRLGVFGQYFLGDSSQVSENLIVHDCVAALKYVNAEISNFGGNPDNTTIMGHSSGGSLVDALGFSHLVDPDLKLFQQLIVLSSHGVYGLADITINNSFEISRRVGCTSQDPKTILECMRTKDALEILQKQKEMEENDNLFFKAILRGAPIMDFNGKISDLKKSAPARRMLCGVSEHEFEKFHYVNYYVSGTFLDFENPTETIMAYRNNFTNSSIGLYNSDTSAVFVSAATYSEALVNAGGEVFLFETRQKPYSVHVSDMQFFIGIHRESVHTSDMDILDSFYSKMIVNFTKFGEPSPTWEKLDPAKMNFLALEVDTELGIEPKMEEGFHQELVDYWLINMMELDRNITEQKKKQGYQPTASQPRPTFSVLKTSTSSSNLEVSSEKPENPIPTEEPLESADVPIYKQWWFYVIIVFIVLVLVFVFIVLRRSTVGESEPLIV